MDPDYEDESILRVVRQIESRTQHRVIIIVRTEARAEVAPVRQVDSGIVPPETNEAPVTDIQVGRQLIGLIQETEEAVNRSNARVINQILFC